MEEKTRWVELHWHPHYHGGDAYWHEHLKIPGSHEHSLTLLLDQMKAGGVHYEASDKTKEATRSWLEKQLAARESKGV